VTAAAAGQPFDLDAAIAAAASETEAVPFDFIYKGEKYTVPPATAWPLRAQALIAAGEADEGMQLILEGTTYRDLSNAGMTMGELTVLLDAVGKHAGIGGLGNSSEPAGPGSTQT